jgi:dethiobiotin synthetase
MKKSLLIAGTNTDVGKTFVTVSLVFYQQKYQKTNSTGLLKLMQTGQGDRELYEELFADSEAIKVVTPLQFEAPLAPPVAAAKEQREIDLKWVWQSLSQLQQQQDFVFIEALGGLGSPVTEELTIANLAADWRLPTVLVVPVALGAISQAVANVALARSLKIDLKGILLNCSDREAEAHQDDLAPKELIETLTQTVILGTLPYVGEIRDRDSLAAIVSDWDLELMGMKLITNY